MEILEFTIRESGEAPRARLDAVMRAYVDAERARASRRFLWRAVPVLAILLIAVQIADGLLARTSVAVVLALGTAVAAAAAVEEWRASKRLHAVIRRRSDIS